MQSIISLITSSIQSLYGVDYTPDISPAPRPELGEYCINVFPLTKTVGKAPPLIAEEIASALAKHTDIFVSTSATGGYVNFFLTDSVWFDILDGTNNNQQPTRNETIIVDYIGANAGKPLHIGHICTPSIGQVIANVYTHLGYRVIGDSHYGDWGGIFGAIIYSWKFEKTLFNWDLQTRHDFLNDYTDFEFLTNEQRTFVMNELLRKEGIKYILYLYTKFHSVGVCEPNKLEEIRKEKDVQARIEFKKLSEGDAENVELWRLFTSISLAETEKKLELLNVHATYNIGESFYEGLSLPRPTDEDYPDLQYTMKDIVAELIQKGIATQNEDGSVGVVFPEESKFPSCVLQKKDGTGLYLTSDLAAIKYRLTNGWNPTKIIYSVDVRQQLHLRQVFWIAKQAWGQELGAENIEFFHAFNGFIKLKEGAMSTRHGTVIFLEKLIEEGNERTETILAEKGRTGDKSLSPTDVQAITIAAIKYSYLAQDREKDVTFDWDKALNFEGNSGPYIQYAYVRAKKISTSPQSSPAGEGALGTTSPLGRRGEGEVKCSTHDKSLIQTLARMPEVIETVARTYKPHHLALYAYDLAVAFNSFYVHTPKILEESDAELKALRLALVSQTASGLHLAFELLGIEMPTEM